MNLKDVAAPLINKLWLVLMVTFISTGISAYYNLNIAVPKYEADTTLYIMARVATADNPLNYDDITVSKQLAKDYKEIMKSTRVAGATLSKLKITDMTPSELTENVNVRLIEDTNILRVSVIDENPLRARDISNMLSRVFIDTIHEINTVNSLGIVDTARIPTVPIGNTIKNIILACIAGFITSSTLVILVSGMNSRIKSLEEVEKATGLKVIGILPKMDIK